MAKHLIYILFLSITFLSCNSEKEETTDNSSCNCDDLQLDLLYNHFYISNRKEPYTGICYKLNKKSDTIETINYRNGKVEGILTKYFESGQKKSETNFIYNKYDGDYFEWNEAGELIFHCLYDDGEFDTTLIDNRR